MNTILLELPADALPSPAESPKAFVKEARFILALKFFEMGRMSSGKVLFVSADDATCGFFVLQTRVPTGANRPTLNIAGNCALISRPAVSHAP